MKLIKFLLQTATKPRHTLLRNLRISRIKPSVFATWTAKCLFASFLDDHQKVCGEEGRGGQAQNNTTWEWQILRSNPEWFITACRNSRRS